MIIPNNEMLTGITKKIRLMEEGAADHIVASSYPYNIPDSNPDPNKIRIASDPYSGISNFTENRFKEDRMLSLIELYEKTPYTPNVKVPVLKESDNGDEALLKMLPFIPMEYRHLLVWKSNVKEMLFRPKHGKNKTDNKILMLAIGRISTADDLQDPISAINHMIELVDMHEFDHDFCVMAICLDFYKKGEKTFGRLIYDEVFRQLWARDGEGLELIPNAIGAPEISRISRRMSVIFDVAEHCHFFDLKLMEGNDRTNLALPENAGVLAEKAAEAQIEVTRLGTRISKFKRGTMKRFRAIPGIKTFAFDVKSEVDDKGRTVNAWWVKKSMEFSILQYLIDQVLLAPNLGYLKKQVKEKFDYEISEDTIRKVLLDEKIVGLLRRPYKRRVLNPQTEKYHYRDCPLPADLENDFRQIDRPPFQVFAPDIVMTDPETYIKIRERLIDEKAARQQPTPHCRQKGHRPKGENGDHVLSGVLKCAVGQCRETYALAGPSGTDLMACQGRTKGRGVNRCAQHHYLHASVFILLIIQMIKGFFRELFPEFCSIYREEARARVDKLKNERDAFHDCLLKQQQHIQDVVKGVDRFGNTTKAKLDALLEPEFEKVKRFERLIDERGSAIRLVEENLSLENETVEARLSCLETIFLENPRIANEALRAIIDRIDIQSVQRDEYFDMSGKKKAGALHIAGALFLKSQTLFSMFKSTPALGNFIMPSISTKVDRTIVPTTSVEGHILMNFEVFISIQPSFMKKDEGHGIDFLWAFVPARRTFQEHAINILPSTSLPYERLSLLGIQVKDSSLNPGNDPGIHTPFNYPNNGTDAQNSAFYHIDRAKRSTMEASEKDFLEKKATFEKGIRFQFNLFTEKLDPIIPKNMRIVRHREHGRIYTRMHEVLVEGVSVMVPNVVERRKQKPRAKRQINKIQAIENTYKYAVKTFSLFDEE